MNAKEFIQSQKGLDYEESKHDCVLFIAKWVDHNCGTEYAAELGGTYTSILTGLREHIGLSSIADRLDTELTQNGFIECSIPSEGAIVILDNGFPAIFCDGECIAPLPAMAGLAHIHPKHAVAFYRLP